jgi:SAM-dependent methyltransferase
MTGTIDWQGAVGDVWADEWQRTDRTFIPVDSALFATVTAGDLLPTRILDIGCGAGGTTLAFAARFSEASLIGLDLSERLLAVARARDTARRCTFVAGDASSWSGASGFDLLVSRHGVMFFDEPVAAFRHLRTLALPGGRLVFSCFRAASANPWTALIPGPPPGDPHAPGPFAFADRGRVAAILAAAGWQHAQAQALDYPYVAGEGDDPVSDAVGFFRRIGPAARMLASLSDSDRHAALDAMRRGCADYRDENRVVFPAAAWIWSAAA